MLFEKPSNYPSSDYRSRNFKGDWRKHFINNYIDSVSSIGCSFASMDYFCNYKDEHLPSSLYKFMPPTIYSLSSILQQTVYLSSPHNFNDPFDSYLCVNEEEFIKMYILQELKKKGYVKYNKECNDENGCADKLTEKEYWEIYYSGCEDKNNYRNKSFSSICYSIKAHKSKAFNELWNDLEYNARKECDIRIKYLRNVTYRISCFSCFTDEDELMENTTMWSHYADNHRGFCVKYSLDFNETKYKGMLSCGLFPVKYSSRIEKITTKQLLNLNEKNDSLHPNDAIKKKVLKSLLTKSRFWNYEKEWRLILSKKDSYLLYENNIPFTKIEAIYLGCRIDKSIEQLLITTADRLDFKILKTEQSESKFTLSCHEVDIKKNASTLQFLKINKINSIENNDDRIDVLRRLMEDDNCF